MAHIWMSHGTHSNESYSVLLISTGCNDNKSLNTYDWVMAHSYVLHDSFIYVPWRIHMCAMTHSYVCNDSFICVTRRIHMCAMTHSYVCHDALVCVTWLIHRLMHTCALTRWYEYYNIHKWMSHTRSQVPTPMSHGTHMNESWHTYEWVMANIWMSHIQYYLYSQVPTPMSHVAHMNESAPQQMSHVAHRNESWHLNKWVMSRIWMSHGTLTNESCRT